MKAESKQNVRTLDPEPVSERSIKAKCVSASRVLAERMYIRVKSVSERSIITKCVFESRILAERVYIAPNSVSERHNIANSVSQNSSRTCVHYTIICAKTNQYSEMCV